MAARGIRCRSRCASAHRAKREDHSSRRRATRQRSEVGGERGIRTLGRVSPTHAFQACSFNHSDISPSLKSTICERSAIRLSQIHRDCLAFVARIFDSATCDRAREPATSDRASTSLEGDQTSPKHKPDLLRFRAHGSLNGKILSPHAELDCELTRRSWTSGVRVGRRAKGSRDVVRLREIACTRRPSIGDGSGRIRPGRRESSRRRHCGCRAPRCRWVSVPAGSCNPSLVNPEAKIILFPSAPGHRRPRCHAGSA